MAADDTPGARDNPRFLGTGAPSTATDLNLISAYAALMGNRMVGTTAARVAFATKAWEGLRWRDSDAANDAEYEWTGSAWRLDKVPLIGYIPTLTGITLGNGTLKADYSVEGGVAHVSGYIIAGSTTAITGVPTMTLPLTQSAKYSVSGMIMTLGTADFRDITPSGYVQGFVQNHANGVGLYVQNSAGSYGQRVDPTPAIPFALGAGDVIAWQFNYELV